MLIKFGIKKGHKQLKRCDEITRILNEKKAEDIEVIDLTSKDYVVEYVVIATALNSKHGYSLLNYLKNELKPKGEEFLRVEEQDDWTIIDLGDVFVHLMSEAYREKYCIEEFLNEIKNKEA